jgi:AcrR family transcriptional regulator
MGNREDLLEGAKSCLYAKGYARTTVRDLASAANVSMAAIGYHFGSRETLLNAALIEANRDWGETLAGLLRSGTASGATPADRLATIWNRMIETFPDHKRLWAVSFEVFSQADPSPELREQLANGLIQAFRGLARLFHGYPDGEDGQAADESPDARAVGQLHQAILSGLMVQWLVVPDQAPSGNDLVRALRLISADLDS